MKKSPEGLSIVQLAPPQDTGLGDYTYRVESPGRAMSALEEVRTVISITGLHRDRESLLRECDILLLQHVCDPDLLPVIAERRDQGLVTVFEIGDNIEHVQPWNMTFGFWQNEENRSLLCRLIFSCDGLQANNGELLKAFGHLNGSQALFPNHLPELPPQREDRSGGGLVIGWGGSHDDIEDIRSIAPVLIPWLRSNRRVRLALMAPDAILDIFADLPAEQKLFRMPGTIRDYYGFLQTVDIGLAPLQDTPCNRCRSDVKFIEYAAFGALPLLQDLAPYRDPSIPGGTRCLFKDPRELPHVLDQFLSRPELRKQICGCARTYAARNRLEDQHARERIRFYCSLFRTKVSSGKKGTISALQGYVPYAGTAFEQNLYNGLVCLETRESPDAARAHFLEAEKRVPGHFLPPLFLSRCSGDPIGDLHRSLERNPRGLKARLLLGEAYAQKGDAVAALGVYKEMIEQCPGYDLPYRRAAELLSRLNMKKEAESLARSAADLDLRKKDRPAASPVSTVSTAAPTPAVNGAELYLIMPRGMNYGWGICGKYLAREISALTNIRCITEPFTAEDIGDELDEMLLRRLCLPQDDVERLVSAARGRPVDVPVIQAIQGGNLLPWGPQVPSVRRIGYTFFEDNILSPRSIRNGDEHFDVVVAGSRWCEEVLQSYGLRKTRTIIQGVDPAIFHPRGEGKDYFKDRFVIFSGGKFELRKGQDLVLSAFRHLSQKYDDVLLVISWFNAWPASMKSMSASPYIRFEAPNGDYPGFIRRLLTANGIAPEKVLSLPPKPNVMMARIYGNTDIGLFPNRCEGGTNLVLMEYMACGKPVIASFNSGHRDILTDENALVVRRMKKMNLLRDGAPTAVWDDPDLDEVVEKLEWAYLNREKLAPIARRAGEDLARLTWTESARQFYDLACGGAAVRGRAQPGEP